MASEAVINLVARDQRFRGVTNRVMRSMQRLKARMEGVARAARRMLFVGLAAIGGMLKLSAEQSKAEAKLEAVLRATGNAAGFTAKQIKQQAAALQKLTGIGDETIISMQAVIATFKNIKGDEFIRTTQAVLDMATVLDTDLRSAAIQVGKALNDPLTGMTMLRRSGVSFTVQQVEMVKSLIASGREMEAQRIILVELESEFGGAAKAVGDTFHGAMMKAGSAIGDAAEKIGTVFVPQITAMTKWVVKAAEATAAWSEANKILVITIGGVSASLLLLGASIGPLIRGIKILLVSGGALLSLLTGLAATPVAAALLALVGVFGAVMLAWKGYGDEVRRSIKLEEELRQKLEASTKAIEDQESAAEKAAAARRARNLERRLAQQEALGKEIAQARGRLGEQITTFGLDPGEAMVRMLQAKGATDQQLRMLRVQLNILRTLNEQVEAEKKRGRVAKETAKALERQEQALDDEADRIRELIMTDEERKRRELERLDILVERVRLTQEEADARRQQIRDEGQGALAATIEDAASMFRRIQAAAGGRRAGPTSAADRAATAAVDTAKNTKKNADATQKMATAVAEIAVTIEDLSGRNFQAVYG